MAKLFPRGKVQFRESERQEEQSLAQMIPASHLFPLFKANLFRFSGSPQEQGHEEEEEDDVDEDDDEKPLSLLDEEEAAAAEAAAATPGSEVVSDPKNNSLRSASYFAAEIDARQTGY